MNKPDQIPCYHCGRLCRTPAAITSQDKIFCCTGCKLAHDLLDEKELGHYYQLSPTPGITPLRTDFTHKYSYLDDPDIVRQLSRFSSGKEIHVQFRIPAIHCSSCLWLLENIYRLHQGILNSRVNFMRKEVSIQIDSRLISLRELVELLTSIGYEPEINLASLQQQVQKKTDYELYIKIGISGFAFGNIMLLSLPEYLSRGGLSNQTFTLFFGILNILLSLPVMFYCAMDYFKSAWQDLRQKHINLDVPISLGILALFLRSLYEIIYNLQPGYMDSFSGLVFFLLIGKLFQKKTYDSLSFERDFRSYFPLSVTRKNSEGDQSVSIEKIRPKDRLLIRNQELIPADSVLISEQALIDYSFVTGESIPVKKHRDELIYAGGRQIGKSMEIEVIKEVAQSYLTQLWTSTSGKSEGEPLTSLANSVSRYFTLAVLTCAVSAALYWFPLDWVRAVTAFTSVLVVACPCALALSTPFTFGNTLRIFARNGFYLKQASVVETLARIQVIIFDKTGTLTQSSQTRIGFSTLKNQLRELSSGEKLYVRSLVKHSTHPLSQILLLHLSPLPVAAVQDYQELPGQGLVGSVDGKAIRLGSAQFIGTITPPDLTSHASTVFLEIDGKVLGYFEIQHSFRAGLKEIIHSLQRHFRIFLLSGDQDHSRKEMRQFFEREEQLLFNQTPFEKLNFVKQLQQEHIVMMIGDGLNDAGALKQSDIGISVADDISAFTPASDAILDAGRFTYLPVFMRFSKSSIKIIWASFFISFLYNVIGLFFAVQGTLSPLIAAILMPISSISVVLFTIGITTLMAKKMKLAGKI
jgi:Cu+-exporting ATPase